MTFKGRDLRDLQKHFFDCSQVTFSLFHGQVILTFINESGRVFHYPIQATNFSNKEQA
jgi:hypothetical protein